MNNITGADTLSHFSEKECLQKTKCSFSALYGWVGFGGGGVNNFWLKSYFSEKSRQKKDQVTMAQN